MKHVRALTYEPKIQPVLSGECLQTIRSGWTIQKGDEILLHGWEGVPYSPCSKWSWRLRVTVESASPIRINQKGIMMHLGFVCPLFYEWNTPQVDNLAQRDYIDPPTGLELKNVLEQDHKFTKTNEPFQIIRWVNKE